MLVNEYGLECPVPLEEWPEEAAIFCQGNEEGYFYKEGCTPFVSDLGLWTVNYRGKSPFISEVKLNEKLAYLDDHKHFWQRPQGE